MRSNGMDGVWLLIVDTEEVRGEWGEPDNEGVRV